jgi:RHS repeat-associated protein
LRFKVHAELRTEFRWQRNQLWSIVPDGRDEVGFTVLPGELVPREQITGGIAYTAHTDQLGRVMELIDEQGNIAWQNRQDVWGGDRPGTDDGVECWLEYPGQLWDPQLGLYYHRYRFYDPATAHFVVPDPIGLWGGWDPYAYPCDPVNQADPMGLSCQGKANEPTLYRGDSRSPDQICRDGFVPQDPTQTPLQHMNGGCGWVSTAYEGSTAEHFAHSAVTKYGGNPYVYVIDNPGCGVEVECDPEVQEWQKDVGMDDDDTEHEVAFNKAVPGSNVLGYYDARLGPTSFQTC